MRLRRFNEKSDNFQNGEIVLRYWAFDWDDNILNMSTKILMDQKVGDEWKPIEVSTSRFAEIRNDLENYRIRNGNPTVAFSEFRDTGARGEQAFIEDVETAISTGELGPAFDKFLQCLSEGGIFSIITARGHEPQSIRKGVEYIIDEVLAKKPGSVQGMSMADEMFQNVKKFQYWFIGKETTEFKLTGRPSQNEMIREYLDNCDYFGVSSTSFANQFSGGSVQSPEESKKQALRYSIDKCVDYAKYLEDKMNRPVRVTYGMSDDDPRTSKHIIELFHDISTGEEELSKYISLRYYQTTDPKNVIKTTFGNVREAAHQAPGMEGSVMPFTTWNNMTQRLYPSSRHGQTDDYYNQMKNRLGQLSDLKKYFVFNRKKKK